ncbi:DUF302 domain-containing protein [Haloarchaeobius amylolyticus]|uniref:DUF302 domain-containing protein n=1 Tax=Haloarchaeobius amylolyticus TaxID=1198296 RepID=UPI00226DDB5A|nr:DUF302 domain-containing protein [Haloarchaeobius amylolyticus]
MVLNIDPDQLSDDDLGKKQATLEMEHEEAIEHVREAFADAGFGTLVEFSPSEVIKEKTGSEHDPYYVLGACHPEMADRALDISKEIGGIMPCNVVVWEEAPGRQHVYHVSIMKIARLLGMAPDDETWEELVSDTGELVEQAWANVEDV